MLNKKGVITTEQIEENIKNSHARIVSFSRNNIGLIDITKEISSGNITFVGDNIFLDSKTKMIYRFKSNITSGGSYLGRKEIYESLISRMVAKFGKTIEYFPAEFNGERGVLCLDWSNLSNDYQVLSRQFNFYSLKDFEDVENRKSKFSPQAIKDIQKAPQHFMVGNCDFLPRNIAFRYLKNKISDILYFDFGYSAFLKLESNLVKANLDINTNNIKRHYDYNIWAKRYNTLIGMGANKNLAEHYSFDSIEEDFKAYAQTNKEFRDNIKKSLLLTKSFPEEIKKMRAEGFKIYTDHENIIKQVTEMNAEMYERCL